MTIALVGAVSSNCDIAADFTTRNSGANISGDDDAVENALAVGDKMSNTTELLVSDTLSGGAAGVYDFSVGGADEGAHMIGWVNTKTPINATTGIVGYFRNASGHFGTWNAMPSYFYKGGFTTRVLNPSADFDAATTWTVGGNPAQLDDVSEMGFQFTTITSIMGSFNNVQVDQFTVGFGVRADAGTSGVPNTYQDVVDQDQDTSFWGWHSSVGAKGGLYIGPATGTVASWFVDSGFTIKFLNESVAAGFYGIFARGANTTMTFTLANIFAEAPAVARWSLVLDSAMGDTTGGFTDNQGTWSGSDAIVLNANAVMNSTTIINGNSFDMQGADLNNINVIEPNVATNVAYLLTSNPALITGSTFNQNSGNLGHAIEIDTTGTFSFVGNTFPGYTTTGAGSNLVAATGPANAMIYNNSGGLVTLNISGGGDLPVIRNGAGATTVVVLTVPVTYTFIDNDTEAAIEGVNVILGTAPGLVDVVDNQLSNASGVVTVDYGGSTPDDVEGYAAKGSEAPVYRRVAIGGTIASGTGLTVTVRMIPD